MSTTIKMIDSNMKFYETPVKSLREDFVFSLIKNGQMTPQQFAAWVEGVRDEWFINGTQTAALANSEVNTNQKTLVLEEDNSPQSLSSSIEFF